MDFRGVQGQRWREITDKFHTEVCERGFDRDLNSFVQAYGSKRLDAESAADPDGRLSSSRRPAKCAEHFGRSKIGF